MSNSSFNKTPVIVFTALAVVSGIALLWGGHSMIATMLMLATIAATIVTAAFVGYYGAVMDYKNPYALNAWWLGVALLWIEGAGLFRRLHFDDTADVIVTAAYGVTVLVLSWRIRIIGAHRAKHRQMEASGHPSLNLPDVKERKHDSAERSGH